ncbi:putative Late embryogenesis abundant protein, LEA-14 [Rosa chinensis]|uniref:Putative Late embryogenesis abundant protein, LEA-14 n=1 Tax=Rosa chinensis TaxID=74649 RepID=A0A2P6P6J3_ROSCH|nr:late embryogenesis abundant protein At1g64065 [Rosa chinensis]PRQ17558.1 putative Late embryogenesis abundant protein, LEA-14 [Rosa chinensis]
MAEKYNHTQPAPVQQQPRNGEDQSTTFQFQDEIKREKRMKLYKYIGIFIVFQIIILTVFGLMVMKVKTPKVRLGAINIQSLNSVPATPSFDASFTTQIRVKNPNWGPFKFDASTATFSYQGVPVGQVVIPKSKARMRSTKKIGVTVSLNSKALPSSSDLGSELKSGVLTLSSQAKLSGKVEIMAVTKKNKSAQMDCAIVFDLSRKAIQALQCK